MITQNAKEAGLMDPKAKEQILESVRSFSLPRYEEIPDVGLYLEQTANYITDYVRKLGGNEFTGSMIRNYVKKGLVHNPVKKRYYREQIAYLFFIAVGKSVLSMEDIRLLIHMQKEAYQPQKAYDYFRMELENVLFYIFGVKDTLEVVGNDRTDTKNMLRTVIITAAHKAYLDKYFAALQEEKSEKTE
jgi:DNA-binding transcriptional MerR regulator